MISRRTLLDNLNSPLYFRAWTRHYFQARGDLMINQRHNAYRYYYYYGSLSARRDEAGRWGCLRVMII